MTDEIKTRGVFDFFSRARALRESTLVDKRVSPSMETPIRPGLYPLARPYLNCSDLQKPRGYDSDDDPSAA